MIQEKRNDQLVDNATDLFKSDDDREYFEIDNGLIFDDDEVVDFDFDEFDKDAKLQTFCNKVKEMNVDDVSNRWIQATYRCAFEKARAIKKYLNKKGILHTIEI